ncbi:MAG: hypothetical protein FWC29_02770, partial [Methanomassiliicoccaceae archaeon]|nr:hypothetical protein [Methanomassiliicoccaceae archaeon]
MASKDNYKSKYGNRKERRSEKHLSLAYAVLTLMMVTALAFFVSAPASEAAGGSWGGDGTTAATAFTID